MDNIKVTGYGFETPSIETPEGIIEGPQEYFLILVDDNERIHKVDLTSGSYNALADFIGS